MGEAPDPLEAWAGAADTLHWHRRYDAVRTGGWPGTWFPGGELNVAVNCLDRHLPSRAATIALHWEGEPGDRRTLRYADLHADTVAFARGLTALGVGPGDRVALHLGPLPELVAAVMACARLGAVFSPLSGSLPVEALAERLQLLAPKVLVTQDGAWRHGVVVPLKARADEALAATGTVEHVVVVRRTGIDVGWYDSDRWYHQLCADGSGDAPEPKAFPSEHPLAVHHVPGPRGLRGVVHSTAGLLAYASALHRHAVSPRPEDVLWCIWEVAWIAGMSHSVIGPLACGATSVVFEGMLDTPTRDRTWEIIARYGVNTVVTTPTVVDKLRRWSGGQAPKRDIGSLRRVVTAAETLTAQDRDWLSAAMEGSGSEVLDGWGQLELGGIVAFTPSPSAPLPDPGLDVADDDGRPVSPGQTGELVLRHPWAGTFAGLEGDWTEARWWTETGDGGLYHTRDRARREQDGTITILGRLDPIVKVSGQLVSTATVTDVLCQHPMIRDAEVMQVRHPELGPLLVAWVVPAPGADPGPELASDLQADLHEMLGGLAVPHAVVFVEDFPSDISRDDRRLALLALATQPSSQVFSVTVSQLRAAADR